MFGSVVPQRAFFADEPYHLIAQTVPFGPDAFGPKGAQFIKAGSIQGVSRIDIREYNGFDFLNQLGPDVVIRAQAFYKFLGKVADLPVFRLIIAKPYLRNGIIGPLQLHRHIFQMLARPIQAANRDRRAAFGYDPTATSAGSTDA